jgi:hypothetical protein
VPSPTRRPAVDRIDIPPEFFSIGFPSRLETFSEQADHSGGDAMQRFMLVIKGDPRDPEAFVPDERTVTAMRDYSQQMIDAGVLVSAEGLHPSSKGTRISFAKDGRQTVTDGPFAEAKEVIAGFWMINVDSLTEAVEWASRAPMSECLEEGQESGEIEVRQIFDIMTPEQG